MKVVNFILDKYVDQIAIVIGFSKGVGKSIADVLPKQGLIFLILKKEASIKKNIFYKKFLNPRKY